MRKLYTYIKLKIIFFFCRREEKGRNRWKDIIRGNGIIKREVEEEKKVSGKVKKEKGKKKRRKI